MVPGITASAARDLLKPKHSDLLHLSTCGNDLLAENERVGSSVLAGVLSHYLSIHPNFLDL